MSEIDLEAIRARVAYVQSNADQCQRSPGQVSMAGYAAASIDSSRDVPALLAEVERLRAVLSEIHNLHTDSPAGVCPSCYRLNETSDTDDGLVDWPCPTLRAMGVEPTFPLKRGVS